MDLIRIDVGSPPATYPVEIGEGLAATLARHLDALGVGRRRVVVSTLPIWRFVGDRLGLGRVDPIFVPDGERFKQLPNVVRIYDALIKAGVDRASVVVAVGGGVVGDTAGFAAATFLRGLSLVHVPTTLLAQVDSAVGGKVGVNHPLGKNLIGAFHRPRAVVVDPTLLGTLPRREFRAGLYEVVKYGVIASEAIVERLERDLRRVFARDPDVLVPLIADCCGIKARVVTSDEREAGERRILNFGHTAGHALEAITRYRRFRHGEAVGYGMLVASKIAEARGLVPPAFHERLARLIARMGPLPAVADLSARHALEAMRLDKKVVEGRLHYVLPVAMGQTTIVDDVTEKELGRALGAIGLTR